uniref:uncharacterized protein LOC122582863 n=1 Tax=Erigeron canadensis TaxID=72917 RepID=UPI001CB9B2B1|nr:uncharacterized protein LOC122582863 [Erigeron canadensis]
MDIEKKDEQPLRSPSAPPLSTTTADKPSRKRRRRCIIIWSSIIGTILTIALIILILSLTVFKAKKPKITVTSVALQNFNFNMIPLPLPPRVLLNLTLAVELFIENPNKVSVKYKTSSAILRYKGQDVGNVPIPAGKIGSDDKKQLNLNVTVFADRLVTDTDLYTEILSGNLGFSTYTRIKAKVKVVFVYIHVTSTSTCDVNIDVQNRSVRNQTCHYDNKL